MGRGGFVGGGGHAAFVGGGGRVAQGGVRFGGGGFRGSGRSGSFRGHFHHNRFHHDRFFFGFENGFYYPYGYSYYYPTDYPVTYSSYPAYDYSASYQQLEIIRELDRLTDQVERLREQQETLSYVPRPGQQQAQAATKTETERPAVLVFRDKHVQEVQNYAIVGNTLWIFNEQQAKKVPLSQLDLDATAKLNEERGVEFRVPAH